MATKYEHTKRFLIIGLGKFGKKLYNTFLDIALNNDENDFFWAIEKDKNTFKEFVKDSEIKSQYIRNIDASNEKELSDYLDGIAKYLNDKKEEKEHEFTKNNVIDHAIICIGSSVKDEIFVAIQLRKIGIEKITVCLSDSSYESAIRSLNSKDDGYGEVEFDFVNPERDIACTEAIQMVSDSIKSFLPFDNHLPEKFDEDNVKKKDLLGVFEVMLKLPNKTELNNKEAAKLLANQINRFSQLRKNGKQRLELIGYYNVVKENEAKEEPIFLELNDETRTGKKALDTLPDVLFIKGSLTDVLKTIRFIENGGVKQYLLYILRRIKKFPLKMWNRIRKKETYDEETRRYRKKNFCILGLGKFGFHLAHNLAVLGEYRNLVAVDPRLERVNKAYEAGVPFARIKNPEDLDELKDIGFDERPETIDHAIIALDDNLDGSIRTLVNTVQLKMDDITLHIDYAGKSDESNIDVMVEAFKGKNVRYSNGLETDTYNIEEPYSSTERASANLVPKIRFDRIEDYHQFKTCPEYGTARIRLTDYKNKKIIDNIENKIRDKQNFVLNMSHKYSTDSKANIACAVITGKLSDIFDFVDKEIDYSPAPQVVDTKIPKNFLKKVLDRKEDTIKLKDVTLIKGCGFKKARQIVDQMKNEKLVISESGSKEIVYTIDKEKIAKIIK